MTFKSCPHCGSIKETATVKLNQLRRKINAKLDVMKYGMFEEREDENNKITDLELWTWSEDIQKALGEL